VVKVVRINEANGSHKDKKLITQINSEFNDVSSADENK
jgi:hypothetical protein